ncbi:hypothetical protein R1flu_007649 [Riccia fluitans]|uniref:Uncharacterized protein n=1 Tax=Riccia fluitans TaxID=41844 RepID=A0ABD1YZF6_9MARC
MATWSEELRCLTLFDGEAELTPESRPVWQQNMELRTRFVRYPGPKPDGLHPTHFWFLEHYGLLPYFLQMQAEGIPAKVFFSIVSGGPAPSHRYNLPAVSAFLRLTYHRLVNWAHMLAGGLASAVKEYVRKFSRGTGEPVVMADVLRGVHSRKAVAKDVLPRLLRLKPEERMENAPQQALTQPQPRKRQALTSSSAPARETQMATRPTRTTRTIAEPDVGVVPSPQREVQELSSSSSPEQPPRKEPRVEEPPQQAEGRQEDTTIPGFEASDDELPIDTLRRDISRLRQEVQRTEPLVIRDVGGGAGKEAGAFAYGRTDSERPEPPRRLQMGAGRQAFSGSKERQKAIEEIPLPPSGQKKKGKKTPVIQSGPGGNPSAQPPAREQHAASATVEEERPDIGSRYTDEEVRRFYPELFVQPGAPPPTTCAPQPILVERTLLDRLAKISRPEAMSGTVEEDQAVRYVVRDPDLPCIVPGETSKASMAKYSE